MHHFYNKSGMAANGNILRALHLTVYLLLVVSEAPPSPNSISKLNQSQLSKDMKIS